MNASASPSRTTITTVLSLFSPRFVCVLTWCLSEAVCYFRPLSEEAGHASEPFSSPASCPPPSSLHPDQLIYTCTAWHWEAAYSLVHGILTSLKSLSAINTHTRTHVYTQTHGPKKMHNKYTAQKKCQRTSWTEVGTASQLIQPIKFSPDSRRTVSRTKTTPRPLLRWRQITHRQRQPDIQSKLW